MSDVLRHLAHVRQKLVNANVSEGTIKGTYVISAKDLPLLRQLSDANALDPLLQFDDKSKYLRKISLEGESTLEVKLTLLPSNLTRELYCETLDELIRKYPTIKPGKDYYVHELQYHSSAGEPKPKQIEQYERVLNVIDLLRIIRDHEAGAPRGRRRFIIFQREKLVIETRYTADDLVDVPDISALVPYLSDEAKNEQRRLIFKSTLVEALGSVPEGDRFIKLIGDLRGIITRFKRNYRLYVEQFSLEKLRAEFESLKLKYIQKLTAAVNEIGTKVITVPIAFILVAAGYSTDSPGQNGVLLLGSFIYSVVISLFVHNQQDTLKRLDSEIDNSIERLRSSAPDSVDAIRGDFDELRDHQRSQRNRLMIMQGIIWFVFVVAILLFVYKSFPDISLLLWELVRLFISILVC